MYSLKVNQCIIADFSTILVTDVIVNKYLLFSSNNILIFTLRGYDLCRLKCRLI